MESNIFPYFTFSFRCQAISSGLTAVGGSAHHVDYHFPTLQGSVGGGGGFYLIHNSFGHSLED